MNRHDIWLRFHKYEHSTTEIAAHMKLTEAQVWTVVNDCLLCRIEGRPMPWESAA